MTVDEIRRLARELGLSANIKTESGLKRAIRHRLDSLPSGPTARPAEKRLAIELNDALADIAGAIKAGGATQAKTEGRRHRWTVVGVIAGVVAAIAAVVALWPKESHTPQSTPTSDLAPFDFDQTLVAAAATPNADGVSIDIELRPALQNFGFETARGCQTFYEPVDASLNPVVSPPIVNEVGAVAWNVPGGSLHQSVISDNFSRNEFDVAFFLDVWFECRQPDYTSPGQIFQFDFESMSIDWDTSHVPVRDKPMSLQERNRYIEAVESGEIPGWTAPATP